MSMTSEDLKRKQKAARLLALQMVAKGARPRPEGYTDSNIVDAVVGKVQREVGGGSNPGLGTVATATKLGLAAHYLAQDYGIVIDPGSISIDRQPDWDDFQLMRVLLTGAIKGRDGHDQIDTVSPSSSQQASASGSGVATTTTAKGPDPAEVEALRKVTDKAYDEINDLIGSPSGTADSMVENNMTLDELVEGDAAKVREILVAAGLLKSKSAATPRPLSPEEQNLEFHRKTSSQLRHESGGPKLNDVELYKKLCVCLVNYSAGPDQKTYPYSVAFDEGKLTVRVVDIKRSQLNSANDIGLGARKQNRSLELTLGTALLDMSELIQEEFKKGKTNQNALALYPLFNAIRGLPMDQCNQDNAKELAPILNRIRPQ